MSASHEALPTGRHVWGPIDVPVYCQSCGMGTEHRWVDFVAERIECQVCGQSRSVERVEADPAL